MGASTAIASTANPATADTATSSASLANASGARPPHGGASIDGTVVVSLHSASLKHWGLPGGEAVFVPDADESAEARTVRSAADADALCAALAAARRDDPHVAAATIDGDGNLEHRSGEETRLRFALAVAGIGVSTPGRLCICSEPVLAVVSRGNYPDERFQTVQGHRTWWTPQRLTLRPGEQTRVKLTADVDASNW